MEKIKFVKELPFLFLSLLNTQFLFLFLINFGPIHNQNPVTVKKNNATPMIDV